jgi:hypothetical protein
MDRHVRAIYNPGVTSYSHFMSSRSERLRALEAGLLGGGDPLLLAQKVLIWKRRVGRCLVGLALLFLVCASFLIGHQLGTLLFSILR